MSTPSSTPSPTPSPTPSKTASPVQQEISSKLSSKPSADLPFSVVALYRFIRLPDYADRREPLLAAMLQHTVRGTLLLAEEGINGTIAARHDDMQAFMAILQSQPGFEALSVKTAYCLEAPFYRSKVKLKREIVTMGVSAIDPLEMAGTYVAPKDWNALISDPEVLLIDTRNSYETAIGTFRGAVDPETDSFRDFPEFVASAMDSTQHKKVAMYCTGGIRCEKSTAYLRQQGFEEVYHLDGGILRYLEEVPESESLWQGECFVFDNRVTVDHQLRQGTYDQCHACRMPISAEEKVDERYSAGVSCPHCFGATSEDRLARLEQREKQMRLAESRGQAHIGQAAAEALTLNRKLKRHAKSGDQPC